MNKKGLVTLVAMFLALAAPAHAHVGVAPTEAARGTVADLSFSVPNERDDSGTNKIEVFMPTDHPLAVVEVKPKDGWTTSVEKTPLAAPLSDGRGGTVTEVVSKVTWEGGLITGEGREDFGLSAGPLPSDADRLFFKALQTYASGEVVRWIDEVSTDADRPSPVLRLTGTAPPSTSTSSSTSSSTTPPSTVGPTTSSPTVTTESPITVGTQGDQPPADPGGGGTPLVLGGVVVAALIGGGWLGLRRRRASR